MPLSAVINKLFAKGSGPSSPIATEITANSVGAISTAPGFLTGKVTLPVGTPVGYTVMLYAGDPTFQQLLLTVNTNAAATSAQFILEAASNPAGGTLSFGWNSLQYIFIQANTSTGTGISNFFSTIAQGIGSPSGRTNTLAAGISGMSFVRLRLTVAVTSNPLELAWTLITTASVPPVINPTIGSGGGVVDGSGLSEAMLTGGSQSNPVLAVTPLLFQGATNTLVYQRVPNTFKTLAAVAVTAGTPVSVWTPAAGKKFRLMGFMLSLSVAGAILLEDATGVEKIRTPLMAAGIGQASPNIGNGILSALANNQLFIDVTATGSVSGFVFGTEE